MGRAEDHHGGPVRATRREVHRPTLADVARLAGVSRQTASRVARGGELVNAETAKRVNRAIEELGYRPDLVARALSTGSGRVLGVLSHATTDRYPILEGIERAADEAGYGVSIANLSAFTPAAAQDAVDRLIRSGCDGIVLVAPWTSDSTSLQAIRARVPMVTTSEVPDFGGPAVHPDAAGSARDLTEYLLSLGHRTVWHVAGPEPWNASRLRVAGWEAALRAAGAEVPQVLAGDWTARSGYNAGLRLAQMPEVTAVFAGNDEMALGVMYAFHEAGVRIPADVSIVGYDNISAAEFFRPSLTTVRIDTRDHGRHAVSLLMRQIRGEPHDGAPIIIGHEIIVRKSSSAPHRIAGHPARSVRTQ